LARWFSEGTPVLKVVEEESESNAHAPAAVGGSLLDEIVRDGARQMLAAALQAEVAVYVEDHAAQLDENGRRLVVRTGHHQPREVATAAGVVAVRAPRVNDKRTDVETGERKRFASAIMAAWARKSAQVTEVLPLLYLHGLSSGDFAPALGQFLGSVAGLSAATITSMTTQWQDDANAFNKRSLAGTDYVSCWVGGIHLKVRLDQDKVCLLVMIGVRGDGTKELIALADGFRESAQSWAGLPLPGCSVNASTTRRRTPLTHRSAGSAWGGYVAKLAPGPRGPAPMLTRIRSRPGCGGTGASRTSCTTSGT